MERVEGGKTVKLTVRMHEMLEKGTLRRIISDAKPTVDDFLKFFP